MDKKAYFNISDKLGLPRRCPLVRYCQRWKYTVYFNSYGKDRCDTDGQVDELLKKHHELPVDFDEKKVAFCGDPTISHDDNESFFRSNVCPEISLFSEHRLGNMPKEAISSCSWSKYEEFRFIEYQHFSECLEFIQNSYFDRSKIKTSNIMNNFINQHGLNDNVAGDKVMGDKITISMQSQQNPSLFEVTKEIMQLLQQFEKIKPNATELEKVAHVNDETAPSFKRRAVGALRSGGETAIDEFVLENKYLKVVKAIIIGWSKPD
jgi:hypothetical protein